MELLPGIDISAWQGNPDLRQVAAAGYRFVFVKATEGLTYTSPRFAPEWEEAEQVGLLRGAYHFFHPAQPPVAQAERFAKAIERSGMGELPPALDVEAFHGTAGVDNDVIVDASIAALETLERELGVVPLIYTGPSFWKYRLSRARNAKELFRWPVWWASYGSAPRPCPWPPTAWGTAWTFWQRSGSGRVPGVRGNCDLNAFAGSEAQLRGLVR